MSKPSKRVLKQLEGHLENMVNPNHASVRTQLGIKYNASKVRDLKYLIRLVKEDRKNANGIK